MIKSSPEPDYSYWNIRVSDLLRQFNENQEPRQYKETGLTTTEANLRLLKYGKNHLKSKRETNSISLLISQFKSPIIIIFIFTSILSYFLGQIEDATLFNIAYFCRLSCDCICCLCLSLPVWCVVCHFSKESSTCVARMTNYHLLHTSMEIFS